MISAKQKERELIIQLLKKNKTCRYIADVLDMSKSKVSFWNKRYKKTGNLLDKPRSGRPSPLTKEKLRSITNTLRKKALVQKNKAGFSSKEVLQLLEKEAGRTYTLRHAERVLHKIGLSLITPRTDHVRKDEQAIAKFRDEFKKNLNRNTWAFQS
jgi:transposase